MDADMTAVVRAELQTETQGLEIKAYVQTSHN